MSSWDSKKNLAAFWAAKFYGFYRSTEIAAFRATKHVEIACYIG
jgi:hypothetical protein